MPPRSRLLARARSPMLFKRLQISHWRQFRDVDLQFHNHLTVLTGANGAGKTTLLNILSRHFGWQGMFASTPKRFRNGISFSPDCWTDESLRKYPESDDSKNPSEAFQEQPEPGPLQEIGSLTYEDGQVAQLTVAGKVSAQFNIDIKNQKLLRGLHIPSHRPIYSYQSVANIPTVPRRRDQVAAAYTNLVRNRYYGTLQGQTPNYYLKETLIALAAFGYGNEVIDRDSESLEIFEGFQGVLRTVLPPSLGFSRIVIRLPEVVLVTRSGDFSLDAVSGGIASLIDLAWQVFMYASSEQPFVVTIDEPENHLHPELQRNILGTFIAAFPNVQFICATHNPFIVTSVPDSQTYVLRYGSDHRVISEALSSLDRSGSSNEILRDVLGLPSSSPMWVEERLKEITELLSREELTEQLLSQLRQLLAAHGLERFVPEVLAHLAEKRLSK